LQKLLPEGRLGQQRDVAGFIGLCVDPNHQVGWRQQGCSLFGPFGKLQAVAGEDVPKAGVFPFARIVEAEKVEVPDSQLPVFGLRKRRLMRLDYRVSRALDPPLNAKGAQQVPHECRLAGAQLAVQFDERMPDRRMGREPRRKGARIVLAAPDDRAHSWSHGWCDARRRGTRAQEWLIRARPVGGFYNRRVTFNSDQIDGPQLVSQIREWALELGFSQIGVAGVDLSSAEPGLMAWLSNGFHGDMAYMQTHGLKRARPAELVPGTLSVITLRMNYLPAGTPPGWQAIEVERLRRPEEGMVAMYARGRDYHKVLRSRLQKLCERIAAQVGPFGHRAFTDSAPVLEAELAVRSGQGWRGKHTLVLHREGGSLFFLGEIYVDLALPLTEPSAGHCGTCSACIDVCPTQAIVAPYRLDARRCIAYLTIEHSGAIPQELRPLIGNRIYGCDDCQLVCPWNKFAQRSALPDFDEREGLTGRQLVELFGWSEEDFLRHTEGSPIRRVGHERWLRNVAVALGNALRLHEDPALRAALQARAQDPSSLVCEHVAWALAA
jgi:epoxyqueuosine reductase